MTETSENSSKDESKSTAPEKTIVSGINTSDPHPNSMGPHRGDIVWKNKQLPQQHFIIYIKSPRLILSKNWNENLFIYFFKMYNLKIGKTLL